MLTYDDALAIVMRQSQAALDPVVSGSDVEDIVVRTMRFTPWAAGTTYAYGQRVVPLSPTSAGQGHLFRCVLGGVSGPGEPYWVQTPTYSAVGSWLSARGYGRQSPDITGYFVSDGAAIWQEDGPAPAEMYNVRQATYEVLLQKMASKAGTYPVRVGGREGVQEDESKILENLDMLLRRYAPIGP